MLIHNRLTEELLKHGETNFWGPATTKCDQLSAWNEATSNDLCGSPLNYCYLSYLSYYTFDYDNRIKSYSCVHLWILSPTYRDKNGSGSQNFRRQFNSYWILYSILYGVYGTLNESLNENFSGGMATSVHLVSRGEFWKISGISLSTPSSGSQRNTCIHTCMYPLSLV